MISLGVVGTNCLSGDECLRYSDCSDGLTCAFGKCVVPAPQTGDEGGTEEGGSTQQDSSAPPIDSGATPTDSGSSDLDSGDASEDDAADASDD